LKLLSAAGLRASGRERGSERARQVEIKITREVGRDARVRGSERARGRGRERE